MDLTRIVLTSAPLVVLVAWFGAGQWTIAGDEAHGWLILLGVISVSLLLPVPGTTQRLPPWSTRVRVLGWVGILGLLITS